MWKRYISLILLILLISATAGCLGGTPPDFKSQADKFDAAVKEYSDAKTLYHNGNYTESKAAFIEVIKQFQANKTAYETIAKQNITSKEKYIAQNMVKNSDQYVYAAAFMRDAADAGAAGDKAKAYSIELSASEFEQAARLNYEDNKNDMRGILGSNTRL